jgi:hypothetical protein
MSVVQESRSCVVAVTTEDQYITSAGISSVSSDIHTMTNCGSRSHPWRLEAPAGQQINISLLDFTSTSRGGDETVSRHQYGFVVEKSSKKNVSINSAGAATKLHRESAVYESDANEVNIVLATGTEQRNHSFLIKLNGKHQLQKVPRVNLIFTC